MGKRRCQCSKCKADVKCCECSSFLCNRDRCTKCKARRSASAPDSIPVPSDAEPESPLVLQEDDSPDTSSDISDFLSRSTVGLIQSELGAESISTSLLSSRPSSPAACASDVEQGELFNEK